MVEGLWTPTLVDGGVGRVEDGRRKEEGDQEHDFSRARVSVGEKAVCVAKIPTMFERMKDKRLGPTRKRGRSCTACWPYCQGAVGVKDETTASGTLNQATDDLACLLVAVSYLETKNRLDL